MAADRITAENLGDRMFEAARGALGSKFALVKAYLKAESDKLAITLRMILDGVACGEISNAEAKILLSQQKMAATSLAERAPHKRAA